MSMIQTILAFLTRRRRQPTSSSPRGASTRAPAPGHNATPAARPPAQRDAPAPARRTWENPTGAAAQSARPADDDWPTPITLVDQVPPAAPAHTHQHHCPAPAQHENAVNHGSFQSSSCDSDDYNRNASGGTPDFGGSTNTGSLPD